MAEKDPSSGRSISDAIRAEQRAQRSIDRGNLGDTLLKSPAWKANTLNRIEALRSNGQAAAANDVLMTFKESLLDVVEQHWQELILSADSGTHQILHEETGRPASNDDDSANRQAILQQELDTLRDASAHHAAEAKEAGEQLQKQSAMLKLRSDEIQRLQHSIEQLEAENARLMTAHQKELDARGIELLELQAAYDQFQEQSDLLMTELDQENERLRAEAVRNQEDSQAAIANTKSLKIELIETKALLKLKRAS